MLSYVLLLNVFQLGYQQGLHGACLLNGTAQDDAGCPVWQPFFGTLCVVVSVAGWLVSL
jgi:hypothetical protein